ncbi:MAG: 4-hydroxy-tetrahydrodipicolinate reductase [Azospirillaceae bacterium]
MRVGVVGAGGRMGRMLLGEVLATGDMELVGAVDRPDSPAQGMDAGLLTTGEPCGVLVHDDPVSLFADAEAVLDFTRPEATVEHAKLAAQGKTVHVVGTTGLEPDQVAMIERAAKHTPIVLAPNMSLGVNLLMALVEKVAAALDESWDIEIVEMHHRHKVDAPSGTALGLGRAAAAGREVDLAERAVRARDGVTGERRAGDIGFATLRGGDVVGDHTVIFAGAGERIELTHKAASRDIFAKGAVRAARWALGQHPGVYTMADVLGM